MAWIKWLIGLGIGLAVILLLLVPVKHYRIVSEGTDVYEAHYVLYGDRAQQQIVQIEHELVGIGAIVVDFRRSQSLKPVEVAVKTLDGEVVSRGEITLEQAADDSFAWTALSDGVDRRGDVVIEFKAPQAQMNNSVGLRFEKESGQVALGLLEKVTVAQRIVIWTKDHSERALRVMLVVVGGSLAALILSLAGSQRKIFRLSVTTWLIIGLAMIALLVRIRTAVKVESVFGGDAFNYLIQSRAWLEGANPFAEEFRRKAPLLPFLLLPGWLGMIDPIVWGRIISMIAAVGAVVMLPRLLIFLQVPRQLALGAGLLLAVNRNFWWESVHGLANTLYAALILGAVYAFVQHYNRYGRYLVGVLVGLTTLTRWEGGAVAAVLLPAVWIWHRLNIKTIIYTGWPALVLVAIPFVFWPITGETGMRTMADIASDGGLKLAYSWGDFVGNLEGLELFLGRNWILVEAVGEQLWWLAGGLLIGLILGFLCRNKNRFYGGLVRFVPYVLLLVLLVVLIESSRESYKYLTMALTALTGVGWGASIVIKPKLSIPVSLMLIGQVLVITMILPKSRYYLQLIPFLSAGLIIGLWIISDWRRSHVSRVGAVLLVGVLSMLVYLDSARAMPGTISGYNEKSGNHTVVMQACKYLLDRPGNVGVVEESDLPARVYLTLDRTRIFPIEWAENMEDLTDEEIYTWLEEFNISYIIETTAQPVFEIVERHPDDFELLKEFGSRHTEEKAMVYRVKK
jgi:hypothetical protein